MIETLLKQLEGLVGSDDFEFESEEIIEKLKAEGAGFEIVLWKSTLLMILECPVRWFILLRITILTIFRF